MPAALTLEETREAIWPRVLSDPELERVRIALNAGPLCPKCGCKTSWKMRRDHGMCPSCRKAWTRPSTYELAKRIVESSEMVQAYIAYMLMQKPAMKMTGELSRKFPLGDAGEWDPFLIWTVDSLRLQQRAEGVTARLRAILNARRGSKSLAQFLAVPKRAKTI